MTARGALYQEADVMFDSFTDVSKCKTIEAAVKKAGIDYKLDTTPALAQLTKKGKVWASKDRNWVIATPSNGRAVAVDIVGPQFKPIQPMDGMKVLGSVLGQGRFPLQLDKAGAVGGFRRIFVTAKVPGFISLPGGDKTQRYVVFTMANDGNGHGEWLPTTERMWCTNMMALIREGQDARDFGVRIRHSGDIAAKLSAGERELGAVLGAFDDYEETCKKLLDVEGKPLFGEYVNSLFPNIKAQGTKKEKETINKQALAEAYSAVSEERAEEDEDGKKLLVVGREVPDFAANLKKAEDMVKVQTGQRRNAIVQMRHYFDDERGESAFHLFQSATAYANHGRGIRLNGRGANDRKVNTILFGDARKFQAQALTEVKRLAKVS